MKLFTLFIVLTLVGCSTTPVPSGYLPHDPLVLECRDGELWIKNNSSELKLEGRCED